jgi:hypothetical protein
MHAINWFFDCLVKRMNYGAEVLSFSQLVEAEIVATRLVRIQNMHAFGKCALYKSEWNEE